MAVRNASVATRVLMVTTLPWWEVAMKQVAEVIRILIFGGSKTNNETYDTIPYWDLINTMQIPCVTSQSECILCPYLTQNHLFGSSNVTDCIPCPRGTFGTSKGRQETRVKLLSQIGFLIISTFCVWPTTMLFCRFLTSLPQESPTAPHAQLELTKPWLASLHAINAALAPTAMCRAWQNARCVQWVGRVNKNT